MRPLATSLNDRLTSLQGGFCLVHATPRRACIPARELAEETGFLQSDFDAPTVLAVPPSNNLFAGKGKVKHSVSVFVQCRLNADAAGKSPVLMEPDKCYEWKWHRWDAMPPLSFPSLKHLVEHYSPT